MEQLLVLKIFELPHKFGSNLGFKASGNSIISVNSTRGRHLTDGELLSHSSRRRRHVRLHAGVEKAPTWLPLASEPLHKAFTVAIFRCSAPLFFPSLPPLLRSAMPSPSCIPILGKAYHSSACSWRTQPTRSCSSTLPGNAACCFSSSRPAASPSRALHHGHSSTVSLYSCEAWFQLHWVAMMLCDRLIASFILTVVGTPPSTTACSAVAVVLVDPLPR